jgi:uncharacterized membrane protein YuzA (DUF378 family)
MFDALSTSVISVLVGLGAATIFRLFFGDDTTNKRAVQVMVGIAAVIFTCVYLLSKVLL